MDTEYQFLNIILYKLTKTDTSIMDNLFNKSHKTDKICKIYPLTSEHPIRAFDMEPSALVE